MGWAAPEARGEEGETIQSQSQMGREEGGYMSKEEGRRRRAGGRMTRGGFLFFSNCVTASLSHKKSKKRK